MSKLRRETIKLGRTKAEIIELPKVGKTNIYSKTYRKKGMSFLIDGLKLDEIKSNKQLRSQVMKQMKENFELTY